MQRNVIYGRDITTGRATQLRSKGNVLVTTLPALEDIIDVSASTPVHNDILMYNSTHAKWTSTPLSTNSLDSLTDVSINTPITPGTALKWDGSNWTNYVKDYLSISVHGQLDATLTSLSGEYSLHTSDHWTLYFKDTVYANNITYDETATDASVKGLTSTKYYKIDYTVSVTGTNISGASFWTARIRHHPSDTILRTAIQDQQIDGGSVSLYCSIIGTGWSQLNFTLQFAPATISNAVSDCHTTISIVEL